MSIKKIALTAIAAAALMAPTLSAANAHHIDKKRTHASDRYDDHDKYDRKRGLGKANRYDKYDNYDDYVAAKRRKLHLTKTGNIRTPGILKRMERQRDRIRAGRKNGDLTWREARRLRKGIRRVRRALHRARYDGNVTGYERRELRDMLNDNSKRINRLRNNHKTASRHFRKFRKYVDLDF